MYKSNIKIMDDTHPLIQSEFKRRFMNLTDEERLIIGARMFDAAREIALASMPICLSDSELKVELLNRFYGYDFDERRFADIVHHFKMAVEKK